MHGGSQCAFQSNPPTSPSLTQPQKPPPCLLPSSPPPPFPPLQVVGEDIEDLEYSPKPEFSGPFKVTNVVNEVALLRCWFDHMRAEKPGIYVTYNGDYFDWPFLEDRAAMHGISMYQVGWGDGGWGGMGGGGVGVGDCCRGSPKLAVLGFF